MPEIRCANKFFGEVSENSRGIYEAVCQSRFCKTGTNEVVLHRWDLEKLNADGTIKLIETKRFKRPK
jgi:hypothetical protein